MDMATLKQMSGGEFESYLAGKYGAGSYGLKVMREVEATMKAKLKLRSSVTTTAAVVKLEPVLVPAEGKVELDLRPYGDRWSRGERLGQLASEVGTTWQALCGKLWTLGYRPLEKYRKTGKVPATVVGDVRGLL